MYIYIFSGYVNLRVKSYQMSYLYNTNEFEYFKVENGSSKVRKLWRQLQSAIYH
jgi:hypothetical protein